MIRFRNKPILKALDPGWTRKYHTLYTSTRGKMSGAVLADLETMVRNVDRTKLAQAVTDKDIQAALRAAKVDYAEISEVGVGKQIEAAMALAADYELSSIRVGTATVYNPLAPHVKDWVENHTAMLVTGINDSTREGVKNVIADALKTSRHPYSTARTIEQSVGLTPRAATAVSKFELKLVADGVAQATIDKEVAKYAARLRSLRAETIARTESMTALNRGRAEMRRQLIDAGVLPPDQTQTWRTASDERVCPVCGPLNNTSLQFGETWPGTDTDAPPAHPMCRCVVTLDS